MAHRVKRIKRKGEKRKMLNKMILTAIMTTLIYLIYQAIFTPEWVKINKMQVQYCEIATNKNPDVICD